VISDADPRRLDDIARPPTAVFDRRPPAAIRDLASGSQVDQAACEVNDGPKRCHEGDGRRTPRTGRSPWAIAGRAAAVCRVSLRSEKVTLAFASDHQDDLWINHALDPRRR
jgi:hypothetical protein